MLVCFQGLIHSKRRSKLYLCWAKIVSCSSNMIPLVNESCKSWSSYHAFCLLQWGLIINILPQTSAYHYANSTASFTYKILIRLYIPYIHYMEQDYQTILHTTFPSHVHILGWCLMNWHGFGLFVYHILNLVIFLVFIFVYAGVLSLFLRKLYCFFYAESSTFEPTKISFACV